MSDGCAIRRLIKSKELTADICGVLECLSDGWIQLDHQIAVFCNHIVARQNSLLDPNLERVLHDCVDDVHDELPGQAMDVALVWQVVLDALVLLALLEDSFDVEPLVERDVQDPDVRCLDICSSVND